jgi:hypothetical protein
MQAESILVSVVVNNDDSIQVFLPDGYGMSYINRQALEDDVSQRLSNAVNSMIWLQLNDYLVNGTTSGTCLLNTDEPNGNWVKKQ